MEDGDSEILLDADKVPMTREDFEILSEIVIYSGKTFLELYSSSKKKDWVDEQRKRITFHGANGTTIRKVFEHVNNTQSYYLSRLGIEPPELNDFMELRNFAIKSMNEVIFQRNSPVIIEKDREKWTARKVLRRFIWHDRIHAKSVMRILLKQKSLGLIGRLDDSFMFAVS